MKIISTILSLILLTISVSAEDTTERFDKITQFRSIGEMRLWTFIQDKKKLGTLTSVVKEVIEVDGTTGVLIEEKLSIDYTPIGSELKMHITSEFKVTDNGAYLGEHMILNVNEQTDEVYAERSDDLLEGYIIQRGKKTDKEITSHENSFSLEANFIDRYELFWAAQDIEVGMVIEDTVFMPQSFNNVAIQAFVQEFSYKSLYNTLYDSVFVIGFTLPAEMIMYFTKDKRLVKVIIPSQNLKIYQDLVKEAPDQLKSLIKRQSRKPISSIILSIFWYIIIGCLSLALFIRSEYKKSPAYLSILFGFLFFAAVYLFQYSAQNMMLKDFIGPKLAEGGNVYLLVIIPAIFAGLLQEFLKLCALFSISFIKKINGSRLIAMGAAVGTGFGIAEAAYLLTAPGSINLFSIGILEKSFMIIFHTASGALIGYGLSKSLKSAFVVLSLTIFINSIFRYIPVLVQNNDATFELINIILAFVTILFVVAVMLLLKKKNY